MQLTGKLYGRIIRARAMTDLKRKASMIANNYYNPHDEMQVHICADDGDTIDFTLMRINRKCPNNTITYGQWR